MTTTTMKNHNIYIYIYILDFPRGNPDEKETQMNSHIFRGGSLAMSEIVQVSLW